MRSRSNSGVKLDNYVRIIHQTILKHQVRIYMMAGLVQINLRWCLYPPPVFTEVVS